MYARVVTGGERGAGHVEAGIRAFREQALPVYQQRPGFRGAYVLIDPADGSGMSVSLWETEADAKAAGAALAPTAARTQRQLDIRAPLPVELFEIAVQRDDAGVPSGEGAFARVVTTQTDPARAQDTIREVRGWLPRMAELAGQRAWYFLFNRATGKGVSIGIYESEAALHATDALAARNREEAHRSQPEAGPIRAGSYRVAFQA